MANHYNHKASSGGPPKTMRGPDSMPMNEKTANWPDLPGKSGPDRSQGVKKLKTYAKSKGV